MPPCSASKDSPSPVMTSLVIRSAYASIIFALVPAIVAWWFTTNHSAYFGFLAIPVSFMAIVICSAALCEILAGHDLCCNGHCCVAASLAVAASLRIIVSIVLLFITFGVVVAFLSTSDYQDTPEYWSPYPPAPSPYPLPPSAPAPPPPYPSWPPYPPRSPRAPTEQVSTTMFLFNVLILIQSVATAVLDLILCCKYCAVHNDQARQHPGMGGGPPMPVAQGRIPNLGPQPSQPGLEMQSAVAVAMPAAATMDNPQVPGAVVGVPIASAAGPSGVAPGGGGFFASGK